MYIYSCDMGTNDLPDMYAQSPRVAGIHIRQVPILQLLRNTSKANSLDDNTSVVTASLYMHAWKIKIQLRLGSNNVVAMILTMDKFYRYCGKLNRVNFREIASFLMLSCYLKTTYNEY